MLCMKTTLATLEKCYALASLRYRQKDCFLVAAEKHDRCLLFDKAGKLLDTIWSEPGGVMTMQQIPGSDGAFMATQKFYSPNDSAEAMLVLAEPDDGEWKVRTLAKLPFVHRFDIYEANGETYLIACTLKSAHACKDDFSSPGKVYACRLPKDLSPFDETHPLPLIAIYDGLTRNHGYCRVVRDGNVSSLISADEGVFRFYPPIADDAVWTVERLLDTPASDAVLVDFDEDGTDELLVISPFHGDTVTVYHAGVTGFQSVFSDTKLPFSHAIWGGRVLNRPAALIGYRKEQRDLVMITYDNESGTYQEQRLDCDVGPANVLCLSDGVFIAANRETNEVAMYCLQA